MSACLLALVAVVDLDARHPGGGHLLDEPLLVPVTAGDREGVGDDRHPAGGADDLDAPDGGDRVVVDVVRAVGAEHPRERLVPVPDDARGDERVGDVRATDGGAAGLLEHVVPGEVEVLGEAVHVVVQRVEAGGGERQDGGEDHAVRARRGCAR